MSHRIDPPAGLDLVQLTEIHDAVFAVFVFVILPLIAAGSAVAS